MRRIISILTILAIAAAIIAFSVPRYAAPPASNWVPGKMVTTGEDAIAAVWSYVESSGRDPRREECTATRKGDGWTVSSWYIYYPRNFGSSRHVPGGHTTFIVQSNGTVQKLDLGSTKPVEPLTGFNGSPDH